MFSSFNVGNGSFLAKPQTLVNKSYNNSSSKVVGERIIQGNSSAPLRGGMSLDAYAKYQTIASKEDLEALHDVLDIRKNPSSKPTEHFKNRFEAYQKVEAVVSQLNQKV